MTPRHLWFKDRIDECLANLDKLNELNDWIEFKNQAHELALELTYAIEQWDKFYRIKNESEE